MRIQEGAIQGLPINTGITVPREPAQNAINAEVYPVVAKPQEGQIPGTKEEKTKEDRELMEAAAELLNKSLPGQPHNLHFIVHEDVDLIQLEVWDSRNVKLIKKIPADEVVQLVAKIRDMVGLFLDKRV